MRGLGLGLCDLCSPATGIACYGRMDDGQMDGGWVEEEDGQWTEGTGGGWVEGAGRDTPRSSKRHVLVTKYIA